MIIFRASSISNFPIYQAPYLLTATVSTSTHCSATNMSLQTSYNSAAGASDSGMDWYLNHCTAIEREFNLTPILAGQQPSTSATHSFARLMLVLRLVLRQCQGTIVTRTPRPTIGNDIDPATGTLIFACESDLDDWANNPRPRKPLKPTTPTYLELWNEREELKREKKINT